MVESSSVINTLPILVAPDPALRRVARRVGAADAEQVRALIPRLFATMYDAPGIGLAAPQVGHNLRLVVIDLMPGEVSTPLVLVNPSIVATSAERSLREEGCLSLPGHYADVERPARVRLQFETVDGARRELEADGLLGACLQHEIDHLDGVLFIDHLSPLKRNIILRKLAKERRERAGDRSG